jgi:hypothetical protein
MRETPGLLALSATYSEVINDCCRSLYALFASLTIGDEGNRATFGAGGMPDPHNRPPFFVSGRDLGEERRPV